MHVLRRDVEQPPPRPVVRIAPPPPDLRPLIERACESTPDDWLARLSRGLRLPAETGVDALRRLGTHRARYDADDILRLAPRDADATHRLRRWCAWVASGDVAAWPMWSRGRVVGVRTRDTRTLRKMALPGGREGIVLPGGFTRPLDRLAIVEGPTDCAALLALGITAIGRPSCRGGVDEATRLVLALRPAQVLLMLDSDDPGITGGVALGRALVGACGDVRCLLPPAPHKDMRAWITAGATLVDVLAAVERAERVPGGGHE